MAVIQKGGGLEVVDSGSGKGTRPHRGHRQGGPTVGNAGILDPSALPIQSRCRFPVGAHGHFSALTSAQRHRIVAPVPATANPQQPPVPSDSHRSGPRNPGTLTDAAVATAPDLHPDFPSQGCAPPIIIAHAADAVFGFEMTVTHSVSNGAGQVPRRLIGRLDCDGP